MRSIEEKSFELFPEMQTDSDDWDVIEEQCDRDDQRKAFAKGANYVLDEIEKSLQEFSNYEDSLIISRIIEQLKSNQ
jgi:hypothetical protein